ncbi:MAG: HMA2 domain-containing protein [Dissulfuribacterales bacterium]
MKNKVIPALLDIIPHLEIAHHIPGRIRLRISSSGIESLQGVDLASHVNQIPGILSVRVNALALSATVEYDPERLDPELWEALAGLKDQQEQTKEVVDRLLALWESGDP